MTPTRRALSILRLIWLLGSPIVRLIALVGLPVALTIVVASAWLRLPVILQVVAPLIVAVVAFSVTVLYERSIETWGRPPGTTPAPPSPLPGDANVYLGDRSPTVKPAKAKSEAERQASQTWEQRQRAQELAQEDAQEQRQRAEEQAREEAQEQRQQVEEQAREEAQEQRQQAEEQAREEAQEQRQQAQEPPQPASEQREESERQNEYGSPIVQPAQPPDHWHRTGAEAVSEDEPRVLNANFAVEGRHDRLAAAEPLIQGNAYELHVQIGQAWVDSIVTGDRVFPVESLLPSPLGYQLDVVFAGDGFTPPLATGQLFLPLAGPSSPIVEGQRQAPGPLRMPVVAPRLPDGSQEGLARGRLLIYFENNLLQSASVAVHLRRHAGSSSPDPNVIEVDYKLTPDFAAVGMRFSHRMSTADETLRNAIGDRVRVNFAHNDNGPSQKIVVAGNESALPPAAVPYQASDATTRLSQARSAILACNAGMGPNNQKTLSEFKADTRRLADVGSQLYFDVIAQLPNSWVLTLRSLLGVSSLIQISHTGPIPYAYPWPLLYDYVLDADDRLWRFCDVFEKHWAPESDPLSAPVVCPFDKESWHSKNVICPFGFWGLRHVIEEPVSASRVAPPLRLGSRIDLGIAATDDPSLRVAIRDHLDALKRVAGLRFTPPKPALQDEEVFNMLKGAGLAYFLCHNNTRGNDSWLVIQSSATPRISTKELIRWGLRPDWDSRDFEARAPIIFLNACHSAALTPGQVVTWVGDFARLGASAVLGTEIDIRVETAAEFALKFFAALLAGSQVPLGQAMREARWDLARKGNLLGLSYTLYGLADIWIA